MKKNKKGAGKRKQPGKKLIQRAGLAMKNGFYLEASWILSALIEKKLKKMLERIGDHPPGAGYTLEQTVKRVKYVHLSNKYPAFSDVFDAALIDEIRNWKNQRNAVLNDMRDVHVSPARLERLAHEGTRLLKAWNRAAREFKPQPE
jgi:hypothetical protein